MANQLQTFGSFEYQNHQISFSDAIYQLFECPETFHPLTLEGFFELIAIEERDELIRAFQSGKAFKKVFRIRQRNGTYQAFQMIADSIIDKENGSLLRGTIEKVKPNCQTLNPTLKEQYYQLLFEQAPFVIHELNQKGQIVFMNPMGIQRLGYTESQQLLGKSFLELVCDSERPLISHLLSMALSGQTVSFEFEANIKDRLSFFSTFLIPITDPLSQVQTIIGVSTEITKIREFQQKYSYFRDIYEDSVNELYQFDVETLKFLHINKASRENTGYSLEELKELTPLDLKTDLTPEIFNNLLSPLINGETKELVFETRHQRKDGSFYPVEVHLQLLKYSQKGLFAAFILDKTERKKIEVEKAAIENQLYHSQKLKTLGVLTGGIAHDFNNILLPIIFLAQTTLDALPPSSPLIKNIETISQAANQARDLVRQILLFSQQSEVKLEPVNLLLIIEDSLKLMRPTFPSNIEIQTNFSEDVKPILGDKSQIHQIILNLCTNAMQSMEENGGQLRIDVVQIQVDSIKSSRDYFNLAEGKYICLIVSDTGKGMEKQVLDLIFDPFFTTKSVTKGTGLGLSVVHGIVTNHKGVIKVESELGKGSTFKIYLPVAESIPDMLPDDAPLIGGKETIVIVEENSIIKDLIAYALKSLGYTTEVFESSLDALTALTKPTAQYDVIISDLSMPGLTGLDLSEKLEQIGQPKPFILITGHSHGLTEEILKKKKVDKLLLKPFDIKQLAIVVREVLDNLRP